MADEVAIPALPALTPVPPTAVVPVDNASTTSKATVADIVKGGGAVLADGTQPLTADWHVGAKRVSSSLAPTVGDNLTNKTFVDAGDAAALKKDGSNSATADLNLGGHRYTNAADGSANTDLITLQQAVALVAAGISTIFDVKPSVRLATATALPASTRVSNVRTANANGALPTIDGVAPALNDRIGDTQNATQADRGLWVVTSLGSAGTPWVLTRSTDADTNAEVTPGLAFIPEEGTQKGHIFILVSPAPFTVNTSSWLFADVQAVTGDATTIQLVAGVLSLIAGSVTNTHIASAAAIALSKLASGTPGRVLTIDASGTVIESDVILASKTYSRSAADAVAAALTLRKSRGTSGSPSAGNSGDALGEIIAQGHDGSAYYNGGRISFVAESAGGTSKLTRADSYLHDGTGEKKTGSLVRKKVPTTDATQTTLYTVNVAADEQVKISIVWSAKRTSGSSPFDRAYRETILVVRRAGSGSVTEVSHTDGVALYRTDATWGDNTVTTYVLTAIGVDIKAQGKASTNIDWTVEVSWTSMD